MSSGPGLNVNLSLGSVRQELKEYVRKAATTDEFRQVQLRSMARQVQLLEQIAHNTGGLPETIDLVGDPDDLNVDEDSGNAKDYPTYHASKVIEVDSTTLDREEWGFPAASVTLFFSGPVQVQFAPGGTENAALPLDAQSSPATFSPPGGLDARRVYYRKQEEADSMTKLLVAAFK